VTGPERALRNPLRQPVRQPDVEWLLARVGARSPGPHRLPCPRCAQVKHRPRDDALSALLEPDGGLTWLCHRCGWRGGLPGARRPLRLNRPSGLAPSQPQPAPRAPQDDRTERSERAQAIWRETVDLRAVPAAVAYLESRGLGDVPVDHDRLRAHPRCPRPGHPPGPAIVAPVNDPATGHVVGVWRIALTPEGRKLGRYGLGPCAGCASRLWHVAPGETLAITEGIEDALAARALLGIPAWAALSATGMAQLELPAWIGPVVIVADADDAGRQAARALWRRLTTAGREARIIEPAAAKDANEALLAQRRQ